MPKHNKNVMSEGIKYQKNDYFKTHQLLFVYSQVICIEQKLSRIKHSVETFIEDSRVGAGWPH